MQLRSYANKGYKRALVHMQAIYNEDRGQQKAYKWQQRTMMHIKPSKYNWNCGQLKL